MLQIFIPNLHSAQETSAAAVASIRLRSTQLHLYVNIDPLTS